MSKSYKIALIIIFILCLIVIKISFSFLFIDNKNKTITTNTTNEKRMPFVIPSGQQLVAFTLEGNAKSIEILVPSEFKIATAQSEIATRNHFLDTINSNPKKGTRHCEWMVFDWTSPEKSPWLQVVSLGSLIKFQGKFSKSDWNKCKETFIARQDDNLKETVMKYMKGIQQAENSSANIAKAQITDHFSSDSNSLSCLVELEFDNEFGHYNGWSAMKMIYTENSIATFYVFISKDYPDALIVLRDLVKRISVFTP
jgi:hypothetical protein